MPRYREPGSIRPISPKPAPKTADRLMPLDYMLMVVRDETAAQERRDRMAMAAAPYCHAKLADRVKGIKDQQSEAAETAGIGTPWAADLEVENRAN